MRFLEQVDPLKLASGQRTDVKFYQQLKNKSIQSEVDIGDTVTRMVAVQWQEIIELVS